MCGGIDKQRVANDRMRRLLPTWIVHPPLRRRWAPQYVRVDDVIRTMFDGQLWAMKYGSVVGQDVVHNDVSGPIYGDAVMAIVHDGVVHDGDLGRFGSRSASV